MFLRIATGLLCALGIGTAAWAADEPAPEAPPLESRIAAVTLYSDQALVSRKASMALPPGRSRWEVRGLPVALLDEAARARVVGGGARLANLEVLTRNRTIFRKKEAEEAEAKLKEVQGRRKALADALGALEREAAFLKGFEIGKRPAGQPERPQPAPIDPVNWEATLRFVDEALTENRRRARELLVELDGVEEELAVAEDVFGRLSSAKVQAEKAVVVELEAPTAGRAELEVAYLVPGPGWWPRYDIRADVETGKVELTSYALVRQETGEDWSEVELTFSAAEPARAADLPEVMAWRIGEKQEGQGQQVAQVASMSLQRRAGADDPKENRIVKLNADGSIQQAGRQQAGEMAFAVGSTELVESNLQAGKAAQTRESLKKMSDLRAQNDLALQQNDWGAVVEGNRALQEEIQNLSPRFRTVYFADLAACDDNIQRGMKVLKTARFADGLIAPVQSSRGYDHKYAALRPETVPSDGAFNKVVLAVEEFTADFVYECAPELRELAFLTTRIQNARRQPYLEGPSSVFLGPDFVGDGKVPTTARGESFPVDLGADESVSVRRRSERKRETTGLFTSYHRYLHEVEVSVKNQKARAVRVAILERVPFSDDRQVKVVKRETAPDPMREDRKGLYRWEMGLDPGSEGRVKVVYSVELPADRKLVALADETVKW